MWTDVCGFAYWLLECEIQNRLPGLQVGEALSCSLQRNGVGFPTVTWEGRDVLLCLKVQTMAPVDCLFVEFMTILYMAWTIFLTLLKLIFTWWEDTLFSLHSCEFKPKSKKMYFFLFQALTKESIFPAFAYMPLCSIFFFEDLWYTWVISTSGHPSE